MKKIKVSILCTASETRGSQMCEAGGSVKTHWHLGGGGRLRKINGSGVTGRIASASVAGLLEDSVYQ